MKRRMVIVFAVISAVLINAVPTLASEILNDNGISTIEADIPTTDGNDPIDDGTYIIVVNESEGTAILTGFSEGVSLQNLNIPAQIEGYTVTVIGRSAFLDNTDIASVSLPNTVVTIDYGAFSGCSSLTTLSIPGSVTTIGETAFKDCYRLTKLTIPSSITSIGAYAFNSCYGVEKIINNSNSELNASDFISAYTFDDDDDVNYYFLGKNDAEIYRGGKIGKGEYVKKYFAEVSGVTLDKNSITLVKGQTYTLNALLLPVEARVKYNKGATQWISDNDDIATVTDTGFTSVVTAISPGTTDITFMHCESGEEATCKVTVSKINISKAKVEGLKNVTYSGKTITQKPKVTLNGKKLGYGTDYNISYKNNKNAGTATVTVTGKGDYTGSVKKTFKINKAPVKISARKVYRTAKCAKEKKLTISASEAFSVTKSSGKATYKKVKGNSKITISNSGKISIKKGLKKGTYNLKVKVTSAGNKNYKKTSKTVTVKIIIK